MLKLRILADDMRHPWEWAAGRWFSGSSRVEPFCHPMTAQHFLTDGRRTALINVARIAGAAEGLSRAHTADAALYDKAVSTVDEGSPLLEARLLEPEALHAVADRLDTGRAQRADREVVFALLADSATTMR
ncbi:hypothetical protein [Kitasatospora sp. NPDC096204]|uniref:hypothetical protein n=1 Tax=Kitasatospora sp. NPDC096204 TaxID=3364094 RepID=UPI0037F8E1C1